MRRVEEPPGRPGDAGGSPGTDPTAPAEAAPAEATATAATVPSGDPPLPDGSFREVLRQLAAAPSSSPRAPIAPGTVIGGNFAVHRHLGAGGMGTVYLARDRRLGRDVAIKLHTLVHAEETTLREARAMARIKHPNVVTVHEVGEHEGRVFVAMEYLAGGTLAAWLAAAPRPWREVVARFVAAGRGLAAANAAGVVHRDFKPANVLLEDDRICVSDFGLAHDVRSSDGAQPGGTPRYMAPEQERGDDVDARADVYSFCVALADATEGRGPAWLRRALARGRDPDRAARWPAMAPLLARLEAGLARRRRIALAGAIAVLGGGALVAGLALARPAAVDACGLPDDLAATWGPARRAAVAGGLARLDAGASLPALDGYIAQWSATYRDACRATRVRRVQSEALLDARMACLARRRDRFDAVVELLGDPATPAARARDLLAGLEPIADCDRIERLLATPPEPTTPEARAALASVRRGLERASALGLAGRTDDQREALRALLPQARAAGDAHLLADTLRMLAFTESLIDPAAGAARYDEAITVALGAGLDGIAVRALGERAIRSATRGDAGEAERLIGLARPLIARTGGDRALEAELEGNAGTVYAFLGKFEPARAASARAYELGREAYADQPGRVAYLLLTLGNNEVQAGDRDGGLAHLRQARDALVASVGDHPWTSVAYRSLGLIAAQGGDLATAERELREALAVAHRAGDVAAAQLAADVLGQVLVGLGRPADAEQVLRDQLAAAERAAVAPTTLLSAYNELAVLASMQGKPKEAAEATARVIELAGEAYAPGHPFQVGLRANLGIFRRDAGDLAGSEAALREAFTIAQAHLPPDHADRVNAELELAVTLVARGADAAAAVPLFEHAVAVLATGDDRASLGQARFGLARALVIAGGSRARARTLAAQADADYAAAGPDGVAPRAEIAAWLRTLGRAAR